MSGPECAGDKGRRRGRGRRRRKRRRRRRRKIEHKPENHHKLNKWEQGDLLPAYLCHVEVHGDKGFSHALVQVVGRWRVTGGQGRVGWRVVGGQGRVG